MWLANYYVHCGQLWKREQGGVLNDECPECHRSVEPYKSEDEFGTIVMHGKADSVHKDG